MAFVAIARFESSMGECNVDRFHCQRVSGECSAKRLFFEPLNSIRSNIDRGTTFVSTLESAPGFGPRHPERNAS